MVNDIYVEYKVQGQRAEKVNIATWDELTILFRTLNKTKTHYVMKVMIEHNSKG